MTRPPPLLVSPSQLDDQKALVVMTGVGVLHGGLVLFLKLYFYS